MIQYHKINTITGWFVFVIATLVYVLTVASTASFWDCGEFIAVSYKLMVPHPPGAPFFLLIGRIFSFLAAGDVTMVAYWINMVSVLSSGFTILFLFWSITMLARKTIEFKDQPSTGQTLAIMGAGIVGSLAFAFSDSFWFNAVEAEVYAMSSFFTAAVFWAILKWETKSDENDSDKWLLLIAYLMGLSIGVHLLNLVAIPAIAYVYYFKKYQITNKGLVYTFLISAVIIMVIMAGVIPGLPSLASKIEIFFVNSLGLPFGSGIIFFSIVFIGAIVYGIVYSLKHQARLLNTALLCFTFIIIGYASYGIIVIRSNYNPTIDENDPENVISFVSYLKREQYGDRPLFKGPLFTSYPVDVEKGAPLYRKDAKTNQYVIYNHRNEYVYSSKEETLLPRAWSTQSHHVQAYQQRMDLKQGKQPSFWQDKAYMLNTQIGHMYFRYFGWNFIGRESDIQEAGILDVTQWFKRDVPELIENNKARNNYFLLPFILGVIGFLFHFSRNIKDASVIALLFFFTGIALILYLNGPPVEPRERDYTYVGSFYAFAIWIGFGVMFLYNVLEKLFKDKLIRPIAATLIGLSVPGIMIAENWDDHDRSMNYQAVDSAKNLLNSCAPNAILFTGGDNDTFPLWYVQEVEGFRTDVRVCNLSLLNTDWYINQMKQQAYDSDPLPISLEFENYIQGKNDQLYFEEKPKFASGINLEGYIKLIKADHREFKKQTGRGDSYSTFPSKNLFLTVDKEAVLKHQDVPEDMKDLILDKLTWSISGNSLEKKDLIILDMIANNNWERPIYFSTTLSQSNFLNLKEYTQLEGLAHRLLPIKVPGAAQGWVNSELMYENLMNGFFWRELNNPDVYYDENNLRFPVNVRSQFHRLAEQLIREDKKEKAKEVALRCFEVMPDESIPFDFAIPPFINTFFKLGEDTMAMNIVDIMGRRAIENLNYFKKEKFAYGRDYELNFYVLDQIIRALKEEGKKEEAAKYEEELMKYSHLFNR